MNTKFILTFFACAVMISCKSKVEETAMEEAPKETYQLTKEWESEPVFTTVESALYDPVTDIIYVSNIEGQPWEADGKGSIGRLKIDGTTVDAQWVTGLNAPKGLAIHNGKLFVADLKEIVEIDIATAKIVKRYPVADAMGLNDVSTSPDGVVYFTDSQKGVAHMLKEGIVSTLKDSLMGINGILYETDRIMIGTGGNESLMAFNPADGSLTTVADSVPQPDGIEAVGDGGYIISAWKGVIHYVSPDGKTTLLLDTVKDTINAADIDYVQDKNLVLIPTFFKNTIAAYKLSK